MSVGGDKSIYSSTPDIGAVSVATVVHGPVTEDERCTWYVAPGTPVRRRLRMLLPSI